MDIPQSLYAVVAGAVFLVIVMAWAVMRLRNRGASARIEPAMETKPAAESQIYRAEGPASPDIVAPPEPQVLAEVQPQAPSDPAAKISDGTIEQGYKGFKIRLREKQPGLWVASIADSTSRNRKRSAEDRKGSVTHEYYQLPAALAEARILIDRRLALRR